MPLLQQSGESREVSYPLGRRNCGTLDGKTKATDYSKPIGQCWNNTSYANAEDVKMKYIKYHLDIDGLRAVTFLVISFYLIARLIVKAAVSDDSVIFARLR